MKQRKKSVKQVRSPIPYERIVEAAKIIGVTPKYLKAVMER